MKIFPSWSQFKGWSFPSKATVIALYLGVIALVLGIWSAFIPNSIVNNYYHEVIQKDSIKTKTTEPIVTLPEKEHHDRFKLLGSRSSELIEQLQAHSIVIGSSSNKTIQITYSGSIYLFGENASPFVSKYDGGYLKIIIDKSCVRKFTDLEIPAMGPSPESIIKNEIQFSIDNLIKSNTQQIIKEILECLE